MTDTADSERQSLIGTANSEFNPVDRVVVRSRARRCGLGVAIACCLGVGLSLAVALPLINRDAGDTSGSDTQPVEVRMMVKSEPGPQGVQFRKKEDDLSSNGSNTDSGELKHHWETDRPTTSSWSTPWWWRWTTSEPTVTTTNHQHHDHHTHDITTTDAYKHTTTTTWDWNTSTHSPPSTWWPWWWDLFSTTSTTGMTTTKPRDGTTTSHPPSTTTTAGWLPESCPRLPRGTRSRVDLQDVISRPLWYELTRVQTSNSPTYVEQISCSTMQLNSTSPNDAEAQLAWEEESSRYHHHRERKTATLYLHREDSSSDDWLETVDEINSTEYNQLSMLVQIDDFLLIYECFPRVEGFPNPGYAFRVYSTDPRPNYYGKQVADMLLAVAELWGLNPNQEASTSIRQRHCDTDIGYA